VARRLDEIAPHRAQRIGREAPALPASVWTTAASGDVVSGVVAVDGEKAKKAWAAAVIDVPIARLWSAINDDPAKPKYTGLAYAEVLTGAPCGTPRTVFQYLDVSLATDRWWVLEARSNPGLEAATGRSVREMAWTTVQPSLTPTAQAWADQGMSLAWSRGGWLLVALDADTTIVEYWTWSDPGGNVPAGLASSFAAGALDGMIASIERLARDGGTCTAP
jgi:hypothetical protein